MTLTAGSKLGPYEILAPIGAGGMGEVYSARDPRVDRDVAIKVSTEQFNERFEREIRAVASLNHSNICTLYDVGPNYLVMELVEGSTLADRIKQGPIPLEESLEIARQIADALEAAHEKGIVHRDLKPANIKIKPDGTVKVLDFGLAKVGGTPVVSSDNSPTLSVAQTAAGVILGTAAYMSPEQAKGKIVDKRADIWSFGVVLYEMLVGKQLFAGETVSDILAAVIKGEPDWEKVPAKVLPLLRRCLEKDSKKRLRDIGEAMVWIEHAPASAPVKRAWLAWSISTVLLIAALAFAVLYFRLAAFVVPVAPELRLEVNTPVTSEPTSIALSPDGRRLAFVASAEGQQRLWLRPLDAVAAQSLAGTEGATFPFWSPDSRSIGFFADFKLKRIDLAGGPPQVLASVPIGYGGTWNREGVIVFAPSYSTPLYRIPASGGEPVAVTRVDAPRQSGHSFPQFLPDGHHLLYIAWGVEQGIYISSLDSPETKRLLGPDTAAAYTPSGYLLFLRKSTLLAQRFDPVRGDLTGDPVPVADSVTTDTSRGAFSVSETGMLAYRTGGGDRRRLAWFDRVGKEVGTLGAPDENGLQNPELSPDGRRVAVDRNVQGNMDVWLMDAARGVPSRFTFDPAGVGWPIWSPDGSRIVYCKNWLRPVHNDLYQKASSGAGSEELLLESPPLDKSPLDWSPDGRFLLYQQVDVKKTGPDLWVLPLFGERKPFPFVNTSFAETNGQFSPDGRWVAYQSNESGRIEVYVKPFPGPGGKWQVSTAGGIAPRWHRNSKELFYIAPDGKLMAAPIQSAGQTLEAGAPVALFQTRILGGGSFFVRQKQQYAVAPNGQRFLINVTADESTASPITIVTNWTAGLKK